MCFTKPLSTRCGLANTTSKYPLHLLPRKKGIGRFEGLPQFKWTRRTICYRARAVFVTEYTRRKVGDSVREGETVVVKKLLGSSLDFIDAFAKEARLLYDLKHDIIVGFKAICHDPVALMLEYVYFDLSVFVFVLFQRFPLLKISHFKDSLF